MGTLIDPNTATPTFITPESETAQVITLTVYVTDGANTTTGTVDITIQTAVAAIPDLIVDNGDQGTIESGDWLVSGGANPWGTDSLYSNTVGDTYTYQTARSGENNVFMRWTPFSNRSNSVQVQVFDGATPFEPIVIVNQQANANAWFPIGTHTFSGNAKVVITATGGATSTNADAVKFESTTVPVGAFVDQIEIIGSSTAYKDSEQNYDMMVVYGDGTTDLAIDPVWSVSDPNHSIDEFGILTTVGVTDDTPIVITAEYTPNGCTFTDTLNVMILNETGPPPEEVVIDNLDTEAVGSGTWIPSSGTGPWEGNSEYSNTLNDTFTFTTDLAAVTYNVYLWWTPYSNRTSGIPVTVRVGGSDIATVPIDQRQTTNQWVWIGNYTLGTNTQVKITSPGGGTTNADAVKFTPGPPPPLSIIIDNGDADASVNGLPWTVSGGTAPYGSNSLYSRTVDDTYTWTFTVDSGTYDVYAWWTYFNNRQTEVPYTISVDGGPSGTPIVVDQLNQGGGEWFLLETNVTPTSTVAVTVKSTSTDLSTCADAIKLVEK